MRVILWLTLALPLAAQKEVVNLAGPEESPAAHPQLAELLKIRRLYVEKLAGGDTAVQIRDMLIGQLQTSRLFIITENPERADTVLRGSAEDLVFTDTFSSSEGIHARLQAGSSRVNGSTRGGLGLNVGEQDSVRIAERKHEAVASVRLVNKDGDVIWATTQESLGAKFQGASADVAAKVVRRLVQDFGHARTFTAKSGSASAAK